MINPQFFGDRLVEFYAGLSLDISLPQGVEVMIPFRHDETMRCVREFCSRFYADNTERVSIWGINPGRFGAGVTGLSFTDPVVLRDILDIPNNLGTKRELSAEFVYSVIEEIGGAVWFFRRFFISALCPLGFTKNGINFNFYDDRVLHSAVLPFMESTIRQQLDFGLRRDVAVCFGTGKLHKAFEEINRKNGFFTQILALEHPRFIMQYRRRELSAYRKKYVETLKNIVEE